MKRHWIEFTPAWMPTPLTDWVHGAARREPSPPADPWPIPGRGYPRFFVEVDGFTFEFSSLAELEACTATLSTRLLPSTRIETQRHAQPRGSHWLDQMPDATKPWRYRDKARNYLRRTRIEFEREINQALKQAPVTALLDQP